MVLSEAEKHAAYLEAQQILRLDEKWQRLMPGERKPNFKRAAREVLRRALGHTVRRNEPPLNLHGGMMHEHEPREARLIERTLKSGSHSPEVLRSFHGAPPKPDPMWRPPEQALSKDDRLPDFDLYVHNQGETILPASHYDPGKGTYHANEHEPDSHVGATAMPMEQGVLPSKYIAVH